MDEANALGHCNNVIEIYSNSWGVADYGYKLGGPGTLLQMTYEVGVREVYFKLYLL